VAVKTDAAISLSHVSKWFTRRGQQIHAIDDISLDVAPGEFVSIIGPSGCGKSTALRIVGGLIPVDAGEVAVAGDTPANARRGKQFGFVPQTPALLPWRTVRKNVALLGEVNKRRAVHPTLDEDAALGLLETVGLGPFLDTLPSELSGGMQQRVSLVRSFVLGAPMLLMDEPFSALDEITRGDMRYLLLDLWSGTETTVLFVTHSIPEAVILADRVVVMGGRPGHITMVENIDLPRPRHAALEDAPQFETHVRNVRAALREGWSQ
jgi:NitT/TauT family transport system ATP-binding protein